MNPLLLDIPDRIETARLVLHAPRAGEAEEMHRAIHESIEELKPWMPWANPTPALEATQTYCQRSMANHALRQELCFRMHLHENDRYAGNVSLCRMDWNVPRVELGYWIRTPLSRRGYVTEAVDALTSFSFNALKVCRVEIHADETNTRSRRVPERLGFVLEGILRHHQRHTDGRLQNMCVYSKIAYASA
jgi:RimJ/RimL family protein N-acetyltransferase